MRRIFVLVAAVILMVSPGLADEERLELGGDIYSGGDNSSAGNAENDVFAAGATVNVQGAGGDVHAVGNTVSINGNVGGNIYAGGNSVTINSPVGEDVTAAGNSVTIGGPGIDGNVRAAGATVTLIAPVSGSVLTAGEYFELNEVVSGDLRFTGNRISFGDNAKVDGTVYLRVGQEIDVPASVASADRVTVEQANPAGMTSDAGEIARQSVRGFWPVWLAGFGWTVFIFILGLIWLALARKRSERGYLVFAQKPFKSLGVGILGLSMFFGLVVVTALTLIGIPLVPIVLLALVLAWILGTVAGAYFVTRRIGAAFGQDFSALWVRVLAMALGLVLLFVLGWVPILGWLIGLLVTLFGLGALGLATMHRWTQSSYHSELDAAAT